MIDPEGRQPLIAPLRSPVIVLETLRTLAAPEEVDFLVAAAFGDVDPDTVPRGRESMAFLAGMAARARNEGTPFEATWSLVVDLKGLDSLTDPDAVALWGRIRRAMRTLAETRPGPRDKKIRLDDMKSA